MEDFIATLTGAIIGAVLAGLFGLWAGKRLHDYQAQDKRAGLVGAICAEVSVLAELIDIDAGLRNVASYQDVEKITNRLLEGTVVFDSSASQLGALSEPICSSVVRFYGRLKANALAMQNVSNERGFFSFTNGQPNNRPARDRYEAARVTVHDEAELLLIDLRALRDK